MLAESRLASFSLIVEVSVAAVLREVSVGEGAAGTVERVAIAVFLVSKCIS